MDSTSESEQSRHGHEPARRIDQNRARRNGLLAVARALGLRKGGESAVLAPNELGKGHSAAGASLRSLLLSHVG
jgi:hypothetical protein